QAGADIEEAADCIDWQSGDLAFIGSSRLGRGGKVAIAAVVVLSPRWRPSLPGRGGWREGRHRGESTTTAACPAGAGGRRPAPGRQHESEPRVALSAPKS